MKQAEKSCPPYHNPPSQEPRERALGGLTVEGRSIKLREQLFFLLPSLLMATYLEEATDSKSSEPDVFFTGSFSLLGDICF